MTRWQSAAAAGLTAAFVLLLAAPAGAHAEVVATSPTDGSTVHGRPNHVSVTFDEAVTLVPHALQVTNAKGIPVAVGSPRLNKAGTVLSAPVRRHLAGGRYLVAWRAQADDGHLESSTFTFVVAAGAATAATADVAPLVPPSTPGEPLWPVLVAAAVAVVGGVTAGFAVRRGLRLVAISQPFPDDTPSSDPRLVRR